MKRVFLSLALASALCLSLAVPAFAAGPSTYDDGYVRVTNVLKHEEKKDENGMVKTSFTCVAPVTIAPGKDMEYCDSLYYAKFPDGAQVNIDNFEQQEPPEKDYVEGDTITEPGTYSVWVTMYQGEDGGYGFSDFLFIVQEGQGGSTPGTSTPSNDDILFADVKRDDWFHDAVSWAVEKKITDGTSPTTFSPSSTCTEAQILTFLWRAKGSPEPENAISSSSYYAKAARWAVEQGIVYEFDANTPCTRAMTVEFLWKAAGKPEAGTKTAFTDIAGEGDLAQAVAWAVEKGVTDGTSPTTFSPDTVCTRGHIVTFLHRDLANE